MQARRSPQLNMVELSRKIEVQPAQVRKGLAHLSTVRRRLSTSFDVKKFMRIGSHSRRTAIKYYSDVDLFVLLARNEAKWGGSIVNSSTFLRKVREDLQEAVYKYRSTERSTGCGN